jgi:hypothetical protein
MVRITTGCTSLNQLDRILSLTNKILTESKWGKCPRKKVTTVLAWQCSWTGDPQQQVLPPPSHHVPSAPHPHLSLKEHMQPKAALWHLVYIIHLLVNIPLKSATILKKIMIALLGQAELATFIFKKSTNLLKMSVSVHTHIWHNILVMLKATNKCESNGMGFKL